MKKSNTLAKIVLVGSLALGVGATAMAQEMPLIREHNQLKQYVYDNRRDELTHAQEQRLAYLNNRYEVSNRILTGVVLGLTAMPLMWIQYRAWFRKEEKPHAEQLSFPFMDDSTY